MGAIKDSLTFDDVTLIPQYSSILPTEAITNCKLSKNLNLKIPLLSSAMDTVTESKMSLALAKMGGIGVIHRNLSIEKQVNEVQKVKKKKFLVVTATEFHGSGANLTGIDATAIQTGNTKIQTSATLISNQISGSGIATVQAGGLDVTGVVTATSFVGSGVNLTGVSGPEVYGFTGIGSNLQVTTTNRGADNITGAQYDAFEQVLFAPSGITFSINNSGNLIATF